MKPAKFNYLRPTTVKEALELLSKYGDEAKILAGGQSLIPLLNMRLSTPNYLIDLGRVEGLKYIRKDEDVIVIGTMTRHIDVERSSLIKTHCPLLHEAIQFVGHTQIRHRGTIGGSIAHADPSAELPCVLSALRGEIIIESTEGERTLETDEFFLTYLLTALEPTEIIKEIRFPAMSSTSGYAFVQLSRRYGDFALVEVVAVLDLNENGIISRANLAVGGASPVPCVLEEIEESLIGETPSDDLFGEAAEGVKEFIDPEGDIHGSSEYRSHLSSVLTKRALNIAAERAMRRMHV